MRKARIDLKTISSLTEPFLIAMAVKEDKVRASTSHRHARGQLVGSLQGLVSAHVEQGVWVVPTIHAVWLPPHHVHSFRSHGAFDGWMVSIAEAACTELPPHPCTIRVSGLLKEAVLRAATWELVPLDAKDGRVAQIILDEIRTLPVETFGLPMPKDPRLQRIARAMIDAPADERTLDGWARWGALSSRTMSRYFVNQTGFTFTAWRQRARLLHALELLAADVPVTTIALDVGYASPSAFINLFRQNFGETPNEYRRRL